MRSQVYSPKLLIAIPILCTTFFAGKFFQKLQLTHLSAESSAIRVKIVNNSGKDLNVRLFADQVSDGKFLIFSIPSGDSVYATITHPHIIKKVDLNFPIYCVYYDNATIGGEVQSARSNNKNYIEFVIDGAR